MAPLTKMCSSLHTSMSKRAAPAGAEQPYAKRARCDLASQDPMALLQDLALNSMADLLDAKLDTSPRDGNLAPAPAALEDELEEILDTLDECPCCPSTVASTPTASCEALAEITTIVTHACANTQSKSGSWDPYEDQLLARAVATVGQDTKRSSDSVNWLAVSALIPGRSNGQCAERWDKNVMPGLKKGRWTDAEDAKLVSLMAAGHGAGVYGGRGTHWPSVAEQIPGRTSKQVRERWCKYLDPAVNRAPFSAAEDEAVVAHYAEMSTRWAAIARRIGNGRTGEAVKHRWKALAGKAYIKK